MGINNILPHLPGGSRTQKCYSFHDCSLLASQSVVIIDAAGPLWQCAYNNADDYLRGNLHPALSDWSKLLNHLRSICRVNLFVIMDGRSNPDKRYDKTVGVLDTPHYI